MRIFISYKSEDANLVRAVAEYLIVAGVNTWFNEYEVRLDIYDDFDRDIYQKLDEAVSTCTHGVVFTNNRWAMSEYCRKEMESMLRCIQHENILEICFPNEHMPHQIFNDLERINSISGLSDAYLIANEILNRFTIDIEISPAIDLVKHDLQLHRFGSYINLGPINTPDFKTINRLYLQDSSTWHYVMPFIGEYDDKKVILDILIRPFQTAVGKISHSIHEPSDERKIREEYRNYALSWSQEKGVEVLGVHHVYINNRSHLALTCIEKNVDADQALWARRYILTTSGDQPIGNGETHLIFASTLSGSREEQFSAYCKMCRCFDTIACSFRQRKQKRSEIFKLSLPFLFAKLVDSSLIFLLLNNLSRSSQNEWVVLGVAFIFGLFLADLLVFLQNPLYQRILVIMGLPLKDDFSRFPFERIMNEFSQWLFINVFYVFFSLFQNIFPLIISVVLIISFKTVFNQYLVGHLQPAIISLVFGIITGVLSSLRLIKKLCKNFLNESIE